VKSVDFYALVQTTQSRASSGPGWSDYGQKNCAILCIFMQLFSEFCGGENDGCFALPQPLFFIT
jgi:hypothetical protein